MDVTILAKWGSKMDDSIHRSLQTTASDRAQATLRSITSAVDLFAPGLGSVFGEIIGVILPANREDRLVAFVTALDRAVKSLGEELEELHRGLNAEQLALFEDGLRSSSRATQEARIDRIGEIVAVGIVEADQAARQREILELMGQLTDADLRWLAQFANMRGFDTYKPPLITKGDWGRLNNEEKGRVNEDKRLRELSLQKLISAGLLEKKYGFESDHLHHEKVRIKELYNRLTPLGHFFCVHVGMWPENTQPYLSY